MARRPPAILMSGEGTDILDAPVLFRVVHAGKPIAVRQLKPCGHLGYPPTTFHNPAHAKRLAHRLNDVFATDAFTVEVID